MYYKRYSRRVLFRMYLARYLCARAFVRTCVRGLRSGSLAFHPSYQSSLRCSLPTLLYWDLYSRGRNFFPSLPRGEMWMRMMLDDDDDEGESR